MNFHADKFRSRRSKGATPKRNRTNGLILLTIVGLCTGIGGTRAEPVSPSQVAAAVEAAVTSVSTESSLSSTLSTETSDQSLQRNDDQNKPSQQQQQLLLAPLLMTQNGETWPLRNDVVSAQDAPAPNMPPAMEPPYGAPPRPTVTPRGPAVIVEILASPSASEQHIEIMASTSDGQSPAIQNHLTDSTGYFYYPEHQQQADQQPINLVYPMMPATEQQTMVQTVDTYRKDATQQLQPQAAAVQPQQQQPQPGDETNNSISPSPVRPDPLLFLQQYSYFYNNNQSVPGPEQLEQTPPPLQQGQLQLLLQREQLPPYQQQQQQQSPAVPQAQPQPIQQQAQPNGNHNYYKNNNYGNQQVQQQQQQQQQGTMFVAAATSAVPPQYYYNNYYYKYPQPAAVGFRNGAAAFTGNRMMMYNRRRRSRQGTQYWPTYSKDSHAEPTGQLAENAVAARYEQDEHQLNRGGEPVKHPAAVAPFRPSHPLWTSQYPVPWIYYVKSTVDVPKQQQLQNPYRYPAGAGHLRKSRAKSSVRPWQYYSGRRDAAVADVGEPSKKVVYIEYGGFKPKMVPSVQVQLGFDNGDESPSAYLDDQGAGQRAAFAVAADSQEAYDSSAKYAATASASNGQNQTLAAMAAASLNTPAPVRSEREPPANDDDVVADDNSIVDDGEDGGQSTTVSATTAAKKIDAAAVENNLNRNDSVVIANATIPSHHQRPLVVVV